MKQSSVIIILWFSLLTLNTYAQELSQRFIPLTNEDGLSQNTVNTITQDHYGFIWIGTFDGLNRYDGLSFKIYNNNPNDTTSLPSSAITTLLFSSDSTLWVGTRNGLVTYQEKFDNFKKIKNLPQANRVSALFEDRQGNIWVSIEGAGLFQRSFEENSFQSFNLPKTVFQQTSSTLNSSEDILSVDEFNVTALEEDVLGNLWIGTAEQGVIRYNPSQKVFTHFKSSEKNLNGLAGNLINQLSASSTHIWMATGGGLSSFDVKTEEFTNYRHNESDPNSISADLIYMVKVTEDGRVWVSPDRGGLSLLDIENNTFTSFKYTSSDPNSISNDDLNFVFEDRLHTLWVGTYNGGVNKYNPNMPFKHYKQNTDQKTYLSSNVMRKIITDKDGFIWAATTSAGLNRINPITNEVFTFYHDPNSSNSLNENRVNQVLQDAFGNFWIGLSNSGLDKLEIVYGPNQSIESYKITHFNYKEGDNTSLAGNGILDIIPENDTTIWVGSYGGISRVNPQTNAIESYRINHEEYNSTENQVRALSINAPNARLWVGTSGGGILVFNTKKNQFVKTYKQNANTVNSISSNTINTLYFDENSNTLWAGTSGQGLNSIDLSTDSVTLFTTENGISNNYIYGILQDDTENLWFSTNNGLTKLNPNTSDVKVYTQKDGIQGNEFNIASYFKDNETGRMYFGGINGFNVFHPDSLRPSGSPPKIAFTDFLILNKAVKDYNNPQSILSQHVNTVDEVTLSYDDEIFSIEFIALHHKDPASNQYKYTMEGFNEEWIPLGTNHSVTFTNLDPKTYTFRVKAASSDGIWTPEGDALRITVLPSWWATWWARTIGISILVISIYTIYKYRTFRLKKRNDDLEKQVRERTHQIRQNQQEILNQNKELEFKNSQINFSILSAQNIQQAFLTSERFFKSNFQEHFILFKPRDIVSGDFYWASQQEDIVWIAVADCTGHGVPGAFMTLLGKNLLDKLINAERDAKTPAEVLEKLDKEVQIALRQNETQNKQGMDIILIKIEKKTNDSYQIIYAGAKNYFYVLPPNQTELITYKPDRISIGGTKHRLAAFTNHTFEVPQNTKLFLSTDGYQDQNNFDRKRFMRKNFADLLLTTSTHSLSEQKNILEQELTSYMKNTDQRDDILTMGLKLL